MKKLARIAGIAALLQVAACAEAPTGPASTAVAAIMPVGGDLANAECRSGYLVASGRDCESEIP